MIVNLIHSKTKKILAIALLSTGIAIAITNSPAYAGDYGDYNGFHESLQRAYPSPSSAPAPYNPSQSPGRNSSSTPSGSYTPQTSDTTTSGGGIAEALSLISSIIGGVGVVSNHGVTMYGFRVNFPIGEKIKLRGGVYSNLAGSSDPESNTANASLTYNFSGPGTTFNPFLGVGYGSNTIGKGGSNSSPGTSASSFYYTGGVDLNFGGLHLTTAVNLPNNSAYGTEFQAAVNLAGGF